MRLDEMKLLAAVAAGEWPRDAGYRLGIHHKRVWYLCRKWSKKKWYDWGVSCDLGWITDAGRAAAKQTHPAN